MPKVDSGQDDHLLCVSGPQTNGGGWGGIACQALGCIWGSGLAQAYENRGHAPCHLELEQSQRYRPTVAVALTVDSFVEPLSTTNDI